MTPASQTPDQDIGSDRLKTRLPDGGERADDDRAADAAPDDRHEGRHIRQQELLDEGVEETFPASDPVSVKRIT